jgi:hypothetical protein
MRFRTIIAAAAVPAAAAGLLLTVTAAGAATVAPAVTAAAVTGGHAVTYERSVDDTTSVTTGRTDPTGNGPIWAYDNVKRIVTWSPDKTVAGAWDVTVTTEGTYHAFANPITGLKWKGDGTMVGYIQYVVTPPAGDVPSASHLPKVTSNTYRSGGVLNELFGLPRDSSALVHAAGDGQYNFLYYGIPGAPQGLYFQH